MRHISKSIALLTLTSTLLAGSVRAQDLEPTLTRAAARIAERLVDELPGRSDGAAAIEALAVVPDWGATADAGEKLIGALVDRGFKVVAGSRAGERGVFQLKVGVVSGDPNPRLVIEGETPSDSDEPPLRIVCAYGDADWADEKPEGSLFVQGPLRDDAEAAIDAARALARKRVVSRMELGSAAASRVDVLDHVGHRTFVGAIGRDGARLYRAFMRIDLNDEASRRVSDATDRVERREKILPLARLGGTVAVAIVLMLMYLGFDLKTKGYMTHRLRLLFGTLFLLGAGLCWGLPL